MSVCNGKSHEKVSRAAAAVGLSLALTGCVKDSELTMASAMAVGAGVLQAATLDERQVVKTAALSAKELDKRTRWHRRAASMMPVYSGLSAGWKMPMA
ncbi:hypothetical protein [Aliamphritea spongicola]|nr:hypothetical protein [Aliamphritea spongicola]